MRAIFVVVVLLCTATASAQPLEPLFVYANRSAAAAAADQRGAITNRASVGLRVDVIFDQQTGPARRIMLNAGDQVWVAQFERLDDDAAGFRSWVGAIEGLPDSHVVFTERDGIVSGLINALGTTYQVRTERPGAYFLERVDIGALGIEHDPPGQTSPGTPRTGEAIVASDDPGTFDVLILYTPAARARAGDTAQIEALASQVMSDTNTAFGRSGVRARVRLVGTLEIGFVEAAQMTADLAALRASPEARVLRDVLRADLVHLLVSSPDLASCGIGYLLSPETPDFDAYSLADISCAAQYTPTHEMAHNMGSHHAPEDGAAGALFPYSYAFKDAARGFRTVMAYPCIEAACPRTLNFSNPFVDYLGATTGTSFQDNARSINDAAAYVANFRTAGGSVGSLPAPPAGLQSTVVGNSVTVSWSPASESVPTTTTYVLQAGTARGAANLFNASVGPATSASGVLVPGTYYWRVYAVNEAGHSTPSPEQQFVVGGCARPAAPGGVAFSVSGSNVTLMWNAPAPASDGLGYVIEAGSAAGLADILIAPVGTLTSVVTPAPPGTYYVRVRAQNACGTSVPSDEHVIVVP
jgi:hypothetical protein